MSVHEADNQVRTHSVHLKPFPPFHRTLTLTLVRSTYNGCDVISVSALRASVLGEKKEGGRGVSHAEGGKCVAAAATAARVSPEVSVGHVGLFRSQP